MNQGHQLPLERCPYCSIHKPTMLARTAFDTAAYNSTNPRHWALYSCGTCGGVVLAQSHKGNAFINAIVPAAEDIPDEMPERAASYLRQAIESKHAPSASIVVAASSVDAMLKAKGLREGSLYSRIDKASTDHLITPDMAAWAHEVRLEANAERHVDEDEALPSTHDAERVIGFASALARFLFTLPAMIARGREAS